LLAGISGVSLKKVDFSDKNIEHQKPRPSFYKMNYMDDYYKHRVLSSLQRNSDQ
jgi:hypothetical protein